MNQRWARHGYCKNVWWVSFNLYIYMYSQMSCLFWFGEFSDLGAGAGTKSTCTHQPTPALSATNSWSVSRAQVILQPTSWKVTPTLCCVCKAVLTLALRRVFDKMNIEHCWNDLQIKYVENLRVHRAWSTPPQTSLKNQTCDGRTFRVPSQSCG